MQGSNYGILKAPHNCPKGTKENHNKPNTIQPYYENWYEPVAERLRPAYVQVCLTLAENG
jgi:hypothetical protein